MTRFLTFVGASLCLTAIASGIARGEVGATGDTGATDEKNERIQVVYDDASQTTRITIDSVDGRVALADVWEGIAIARGKTTEESAVAGSADPAIVPPSDAAAPEVSSTTDPAEAATDAVGELSSGVFGSIKTLNLRGPTARASLTALTLALAPDVRFELVPAKDEQVEQLKVTLSRDAVMCSERKLKEKLRIKLVDRIRRREAAEPERGLLLDDGWAERAPELPLVIAVHGLFSKSDRVERLLELPRKAGLPCGEYSYSSRRPIAELATVFAEVLDRIRREHPERKVAVIAHSMGGLVARAAIEDPALDPGNVCRLIMLATPNQGSRLADFNFALGVTNYVGDEERRENVRLFSALLEDTLGASSYDLRPDSNFLAKLNARPRNATVAYTLILGNRAWLSPEERDRMANLLGVQEEERRFLRVVRGSVTKLLGDLDEVVDGKGDGAVCVERGKLDGVDDVLVLPFGHSEIIGTSNSEAVVNAHEEVLARLLK